MITINGTEFHETPYMCGVCPFYSGGGNFIQPERTGFCTAFEKRKRRYDNIPVRCSKLFEKGFAIGGDLVIVIKE